MTQAKPTPGPWQVLGNISRGQFIVAGKENGTLPDICKTFNDTGANAALIAEAGTVYHETHLTPRQLLAQRNQLLAEVKNLLSHDLNDWIEADIEGAYLEKSSSLKSSIDAVAATIAKIEGKHD